MKLTTAAAALAIGVSWISFVPAPAQAGEQIGAYLAVEGQAAFLFAAPVQMYLEFDESIWTERFIKAPIGYSGRLEWGAVDESEGLRFGALLSGWHATREKHDVVFQGQLLGSNNGIIGTEQNICFSGPDDPCVNLQGSLMHSYWELMGEFFFGLTSPSAGAPAVWFGVQPFYGRIREAASTSIWNVSPPAIAIRSGWIEGQAIGALAAIDLQLPLSNQVRFIASGGLGYSLISADAVTEFQQEGSTLYSEGFSALLSGIRAQAALGIVFAVSPSIELAVVGRADFWQSYPTIGWPKLNGCCAVIGEDRIVGESFIHLTAGVRLALLLGG